MLKRIIFILVFIMAVNLVVFAEVAEQSEMIPVYINGKLIEFDVPPVIISDRTMVPMRTIFEELGAEVKWEQSDKSIHATKDNTEIWMQIDNPILRIDSKEIILEVSPIIRNDRTLVPVRAVAEAFDAMVEWSNKNRCVIISTEKTEYYLDYPSIPDYGEYFKINPYQIDEYEGGASYYYDGSHFDTLSNEEIDQFFKLWTENGFQQEETPYDSKDIMNLYKDYTLIWRNEHYNDYLARVGFENKDGKTFLVIRLDKLSKAYNIDGEVKYIPQAEKNVWKAIGWHIDINEITTTLYSTDGRTIQVFPKELETYLDLGWYENYDDVTEKLYSDDGRTIIVFKDEVDAYLNVGWHRPSPQFNNKDELNEYLYENYSVIHTNLGDFQVGFKTETSNYIGYSGVYCKENKDRRYAYDYMIYTMWNLPLKFQYLEMINSLEYTDEEIAEFKECFTQYQYDLATDIIEKMPGKKIRGGFYSEGYEYEAIKEGFWRNVKDGWRNYDTNGRGYANSYVTEFHWYEFRTDFMFDYE